MEAATALVGEKQWLRFHYFFLIVISLELSWATRSNARNKKVIIKLCALQHFDLQVSTEVILETYGALSWHRLSYQVCVHGY